MTNLEKLEEQTKQSCRDGNWNFNPYALGFANGMIFALSLMKGELPKYLDKPAQWLEDKPTSTAPK